jgi:hypothetical protein
MKRWHFCARLYGITILKAVFCVTGFLFRPCTDHDILLKEETVRGAIGKFPDYYYCLGEIK